MKRLWLMGVTALLFFGCTINFSTDDTDNTNKNPNLFVYITSPTAGATVTNPVAISGTVTAGEINIASIQVKVGSSGTYTYVSGVSNMSAKTSQVWNHTLTSVPNGSVTIYVKAVDMQGNVSTERTVTVTVTGPSAPVLVIHYPVADSYHFLGELSGPGLDCFGNVQCNWQIDSVKAKLGSATGVYSTVPGTSGITPAVAKEWTNNFSFAAQTSGTKYVNFFSFTSGGLYSATNTIKFYVLDEWENNGTTNNSDTMPSDGTPFLARIQSDTDEDWFDFSVPSFTTYDIYTTNAGLSAVNVDTYIEVYSPDGKTLLASDDDSGAGLFSKITGLSLNTGFTFFIKVTSTGSADVGDYAIVVE